MFHVLPWEIRNKIRLTRDGRPEIGVYIEKNKFAQYVARVLVANRNEPVTHEAKVMAPSRPLS